MVFKSKWNYVRKILLIFVIITVIAIVVFALYAMRTDDQKRREGMKVQLPHPVYEGKTSVEKAILQRRSIRSYAPQPLSLKEISQILWAAQGITGEGKLRAAPSAGALYPIVVYAVVEKVDSLESGIYRYNPDKHELVKLKKGDFLKQLADAALGQSCIAECAAAIVIVANYERLRFRYRDRSERYAHIEVGHVSQNVYLQAESLGLGTVNIGAFYDNEVARLVGLESNEHPLCIMPLGKKK